MVMAKGPWKRLHEDVARSYLGKMFLFGVDAYSKFVEVVPMTNATSANTNTAFRHILSYFGLPEHLVTDNGTQFTSDEFQKFLRDNDIHHALAAHRTSCNKWASKPLCGRIQ